MCSVIPNFAVSQGGNKIFCAISTVTTKPWIGFVAGNTVFFEKGKSTVWILSGQKEGSEEWRRAQRNIFRLLLAGGTYRATSQREEMRFRFREQ